ncbi:DUF2577 family protein [Clostridium sp. FP1]|uniref:DUF2577 family protein n=1 Tax=Clostridium sp. FP1 TaxID=2724076 RepID=UPI0013E8FC56|nr:DUF2577 family protein [Clostridium sp. FP1]MBZ9633197.1 DUF2577 domain-containing protein [Clostridium sp. FP1]
MGNYAVDIAKAIKQRNNIKPMGNLVGTVLSIAPLKIGILGNEVILDNSNSFICNSMKEKTERKATLKIDGYTIGATAIDSRGDSSIGINVPLKNDYNAVITYKEILKIDDKVLVISDVSGQTFFIVDKVEAI